MSDIRIGAAPAPAPAPASPEEIRLRKAAQQLEGVFVQQLFKAMRETVPSDGILDGGTGEEMFTGMMDEHIAAELPGKWEHGLGAAVYRQLSGSLNGAQSDAAATNGAGDPL
jgi:flagellar protein FlgJ